MITLETNVNSLMPNSISKAVTVNSKGLELNLLFNNDKSGKQRVLFFQIEHLRVNYLLSTIYQKDNDLNDCVISNKNSRKYLGQSEN